MNASSLHPLNRRGFTLVELLVVMAIIGILIYMVGPASASLQQSANISLAGQSIADQIAVARQMAATRNKTVEVRFISPTAWSSLKNPSFSGYHAIQLWAPNEAGTQAPADRVLILPNSIEISGNSALSPLLSTLVGPPSAMPTGSTAGNYTSFSIRPTGAVQITNPPSNAAVGTEDNANIRAPSYFFTVVQIKDDAVKTVPANYATLQVNPDTGRTQIYRP